MMGMKTKRVGTLIQNKPNRCILLKYKGCPGKLIRQRVMDK